MSKKTKNLDKELKPLDFTKVHLEEDYESLFGIKQQGQKNKYNDTIGKLNDILDAVKERYNFNQYGLKTGESYYIHAIKGIHHILQLQNLIFRPSPQENELSLKKLKLYCLSYLIHDLNKFKWNRDKKLPELWSVNSIREELENIDSLSGKSVVSDFFPEWQDYLNDAYTLILGHSRIHRHSGKLIFSDVGEALGINTTSLNTSLEKNELKRGIDVMQLVDILDLIKKMSFSSVKVECLDKDGKPYHENVQQGEILKHSIDRLSRIIGSPVVLDSVSVIKSASTFSNVMLNCAIEVLGKEYYIYPLLVFTKGVIFFAKRVDMEKTLDEKITKEIEQKIADKLVRVIDDLVMSKVNEKGFLYSITGGGVKIGKYIFQQPNETNKMRTILEHLSEKIEPFAYKNDDKNRKKSSRFKSVIKSNKYANDKAKSHDVLKKWNNGENWELIGDDSLWRMARFCHTVFINVLMLYQRRGGKLNQIELMNEFLERLDIFEDLSDVYNQGSDISQWYRYAFFHLVGDALVEKRKTLEDISPTLIDYVLEKMETSTIEEKTIPEPIEFVRDYLHLFRKGTTATMIAHGTDPKNTIICSSCGKRMESLGSIKKDQTRYKLFSEHVLDGISVQKFTNFKRAGERKEPTRMICESCKWKFYLRKILSLVSGKFAKINVTFYLPDGYPYAIVRGIQRTLENFRDDPTNNNNVNAFMVNLEIFKREENRNKILARPQKAYGFSLPSIMEEICGSIPLSWKIDQKITVNEQFWSLTQQVFALSIQTRLKVTISKLKNDYEELLGSSDLFLQDVPSDYEWLVGQETNFSLENAEILLNTMLKIEDTIKLISMKNTEKNCVDTLKHLKLGILETIHYLDSLIRSPSSRVKKAKNPNYKTMVMRKETLSKLKEIYDLKSKNINVIDMSKKNELETVKIIQQMAELDLRGDGFSDYQKAKALDVLFKTIKSAGTIATDDDLYADASQRIFSFIEEDRKKKGYKAGQTVRENIKKFTDLFGELCNLRFKGSLQTLYKYRFHVRSAYLWYVEDRIFQLSQAKKKKEKV